jgi:ketosteroid isomerase-like protein
MSAEQNKQRLREFYENVWNADDPDYDSYLAPEAADYRQFIEERKAAEPDIHFELGEIIAEGNTVVAVNSTAARPGIEFLSLWHFKDGKITDRAFYRRELE